MDFDQKIEEIAKKFNYNSELVEALKRCVPAMAKGKSKSEVQLLLETLERVEIFDFPEQPTEQQLEEIEARKTNERNKHVTFVSADKGEYGKGIAPGAYNSIPIFDGNMNIVDRVGYIHLTRLSKYSRATDTYKTTINLSHLIHELGHAWASQKDEYVQNENGDFTCNVGAASIGHKVDRGNCTVAEGDTKGLFIEETLNTLDEESVLCAVLDIQDVNEIPNYVPSKYQGLMKAVMESFVAQIGELPFSKLRFLKDKKDLEPYQSILESTEATMYLQTEEWHNKKRKTFNRISELDDVPEQSKLRMKNFFAEYEDVYFPSCSERTFWDQLDNVLEQLFDFYSIKYSFNIMSSEKNREIYQEVQTEILREAWAPLNQARASIDEYNKNKFCISMNNLAKQALQTRSKGK